MRRCFVQKNPFRHCDCSMIRPCLHCRHSIRFNQTKYTISHSRVARGGNNGERFWEQLLKAEVCPDIIAAHEALLARVRVYPAALDKIVGNAEVEELFFVEHFYAVWVACLFGHEHVSYDQVPTSRHAAAEHAARFNPAGRHAAVLESNCYERVDETSR